MDQHADSRPERTPVRSAADHARGGVTVPAVIGIIVVTLLASVVILVNVVLALVSSIGPDSCAEASCHGDGTLAVGFLILAAVGGIATVGTWFTARPARRVARGLLALVAIGVPVVGDLIALSTAPDWMI
jgi:hypothetical protein